MHLLFKIAITELAFDYFTLITIYMNYYQFDGLDSISKKVGALRFSLKRYSKFHFAVSSSAGCISLPAARKLYAISNK